VDQWIFMLSILADRQPPKAQLRAIARLLGGREYALVIG